MMGAEGGDDLLRNKIQKMDEDTMSNSKKKIDTMDFKKMSQTPMTVGGSNQGEEEDKYI